ncbi:uncharacterized protein LOC143908869 [Temnothorax americanus]|uniref:uncharacterized protein LOC143908869 n=1 Tax=Temnothorax americanus TaxID=1964332 RepID=UPI0040675B23
MQYFVVFFDDFCNLVPENWMDLESNIVFWPPKQVKFNKNKMHYLHPKDDWLIYKCRKRLGPFESFQLANQVEEHCMNVSTNENTDDMCDKAIKASEAPKKRNRRKPEWLRNETLASEEEVKEEEEEEEEFVEPLTEERFEEYYKYLNTKLNHIINLLKGGTEVPDEMVDGQSFLPKFPLQTVEEFKEFERNLVESLEVQKLYINEIKMIGGSDASKFTRATLRFLMSNHLAIKYSWSGQRNTLKFQTT